MARRPPAKRPLSDRPAERGPDIAGLYGPASAAWRHNREAALLVGAGPRALLLQVAHPLVAEGVSQHSDFRTDPWGRLAGTLRSYLRIVYGTGPAARAEIARLNRLHAGITGPVLDPDAAARHGTAYRARDAGLSLWVHATLIDSILVTTPRWLGPHAMPRDEAARFYAETLPVGRLFGVPPSLLPPDLDAFERYVADQLSTAGPVHPTAAARDIASAILSPPLAGAVRDEVAAILGPAAGMVRAVLGLVPQPLVDVLMLPAVGLLPARTREEYGLPWGTRERAIEAWLVRSWAAWMPVFPPSLRWFPQALAADARIDAAG
ncbi:MAG TPA: oxygenase MpaB family protein [Candidatus Limnocylindrales bacterium]|nr:oxygenase MpaB family protein [Candidatus Limnocylindrales bacterium]